MNTALENEVYRFWRAWFGVLLGGVLTAGLAPHLEARPLTTVREVRRLSRDEANQHYPVLVRGVVLFRNADSLFFQDSTEAIAVETDLARLVGPGDLVNSWESPSIWISRRRLADSTSRFSGKFRFPLRGNRHLSRWRPANSTASGWR